MADKKKKIKTDEKSDSTGTSPSAVQTGEEVGSRSMQNEMAGPVGIADDQTHDKNSSNPGLTTGFSKFANNADGIAKVSQKVGASSSFARNEGFGGNMGAGFQCADSNTRFPAAAPQFQASQNSPVQTGERDLYPERWGLKMPGQHFPAYQNSPVPTPKGFLFPERKRPRLPGGGSGPSQASNVPIGWSRRRYTYQFDSTARPIQRPTRSEKPSTHQSTSESAQVDPSLIPLHQFFPVAPQAQTSASLSSSAIFCGPDFHSTTLPSQAQTADPASRLADETPSLHVLEGQVMPVARRSGPAQASSIPIGPSHMRDTTQLAPIAHPFQQTTRSEEHSTHQSTSESAQVDPTIPLHQFFPIAPRAQTSASLSPSASFRGPDFQSTTLPSQPQTADPASHLAEEMPSLHVLKGKSAASGSGHAQASNASVGPSLKRSATQRPSIECSSIACPGQRRATIQSSVPASVQTAPPLAHQSQIAPVPPQVLTAASFPSFRLIAVVRNLSQSRPLPHQLQTVLPDSQIALDYPQSHATQDSNAFPLEIRYFCCLCNMVISFTSEGLILHPSQEPVLLPCGHLYHKHCLQEITPAGQTENRPCFRCQNMM